MGKTASKTNRPASLPPELAAKVGTVKEDTTFFSVSKKNENVGGWSVMFFDDGSETKKRWLLEELITEGVDFVKARWGAGTYRLYFYSQNVTDANGRHHAELKRPGREFVIPRDASEEEEEQEDDDSVQISKADLAALLGEVQTLRQKTPADPLERAMMLMREQQREREDARTQERRSMVELIAAVGGLMGRGPMAQPALPADVQAAVQRDSQRTIIDGVVERLGGIVRGAPQPDADDDNEIDPKTATWLELFDDLGDEAKADVYETIKDELPALKLVLPEVMKELKSMIKGGYLKAKAAAAQQAQTNGTAHPPAQ